MLHWTGHKIIVDLFVCLFVCPVFHTQNLTSVMQYILCISLYPVS